MKKLFIYIAFIAGVVAFFPRGMVFAQSDAVKAARDAVVQSINALTDLMANKNIDPTTKLQQEAELKRDALSKILTLTSLETQDVDEKLAALTTLQGTSTLPMLRDYFRTNISDALAYLKTEAATLAGLHTLGELQTFASDFKQWRETSYNPMMARAVNFVLAIQSRDALAIADERLLKINSIFETTTGPPVVLEGMQELYLQAKANLQTAHSLTDATLLEIETYLPAPQNTDTVSDTQGTTTPQALTDTASSTDATAGTATDDATSKPKPDVPTLVTDAIQEITGAYGKFIKINDLLKTIQ